MEINKFALNIYSFGLSAGFISNDRVNKYPDKKMDLERLSSFVVKNNLGGIEFPFDYFFTEENIDKGIQFIKEVDLFLSEADRRRRADYLKS